MTGRISPECSQSILRHAAFHLTAQVLDLPVLFGQNGTQTLDVCVELVHLQGRDRMNS